MTEKIDFKKTLKHLYQPKAKDFEIVDVPEMQFLMVDGHGDPNSALRYQQAVEALYAAAYKLKFFSKQTLGKDYTVPPLEGLWWAEDMDHFTTNRDKSSWDWTMMIMTPDWLKQEHVSSAVLAAGKSKDLPLLGSLRLEKYHEGLSAQIMHTGSYDDETPTLLRLHNQWLSENGYTENGKHHEIYLSDPRKVAPEKLKTVLRQPIRQQ